MAYDLLTTSGINSLVEAYTTKEVKNKLTPLTTKKESYQKISSAYSVIQTKITALKSVLSELQTSGANSVFSAKTAASSNSTFVQASATASAAASVYDIRTSQLAKSDSVLSKDVASDAVNTITGTHSFRIKTGDGSGGEFVSNVDVTFEASETNESAMEKIRDAVNHDKAVVASNSFVATDNYTGGASSIKININGTEKEIAITGGGTYDQLMDEMVTNINTNISGVTAEKVTTSGSVQLKLTVTNNANYISVSDVSGFALANNMNIITNKEKSAAGTMSASVFSPVSGTTQFSFATKSTGLDYRIKDLSDTGSGTALASLGLNLGTGRPAFAQSDNEDTAGFVNTDTSLTGNNLNAKFLFNGLSLQRNSNTVTDVAAGMTFTLKSVMKESDSTVSVTVAPNSDQMKTQVDAFITKFNDLYQYLKTNSSYATSTRGALTGDTHASSLLNFMTSTAYSQVSGLGGDNLKALSQLGISFNSSTGLAITNSEQFTNAINDKSSQVDQLFSSDNGIATKLFNYFDPYLGAGGYIDKSISGINNNMTRIGDSITSMQTRIDKGAETLRNSYLKLQLQLATLLTLNGSDTSSFFS